MKKLCFLVMFCLIMNNAYASDSWPIDMYKVSCLPESKEFRVEVVRAIWENSRLWEQEASQSGLYVLNKKAHDMPEPLAREETCKIDDVVYKMKFIPQKSRVFDGAYDMTVQFFADDKYLGILSPLGGKDDDYFNCAGIRGDKMFVDGYTVTGAEKTHNVYAHKEVPLPKNTSYELGDLDDNAVVNQNFNVVELLCYQGKELAFGQVNFYEYEDDAVLPENFYRFDDEADFECGDAKFQLHKDGVISVTRKGVAKEIKLDNCDKKLLQLEFKPQNTYFNFELTYYDKNNGYWRGTYCYDDTDCLSCSMYQ